MTKTINVTDKTHARLTALGKKGQNYNDFIEELLDCIKKESRIE